MMSKNAVTYIGRISYSLYLWHWPVIVYMKYTNPNYSYLIAVSLTVILSILTYQFVERPLRRKPKKGNFTIAIPIAVCIACFPPVLLVKSSPLVKGWGNIDWPDSRTLDSSKM
jgi:peptidoglycan/LPS O-acetylase OafA/YrhL